MFFMFYSVVLCDSVLYIVVEPVLVKAVQGESLTLSCPRRMVDWRRNTDFIYQHVTGEVTDHYRNRFTFISNSEDQGDMFIEYVTSYYEGNYRCFPADGSGGPPLEDYSVQGNV